jgi:hypothetical protein
MGAPIDPLALQLELRRHVIARAKAWGLTQSKFLQALVVADCYGIPIEEAVLRVKGRMEGLIVSVAPRAFFCSYCKQAGHLRAKCKKRPQMQGRVY